MTSIAKAAKTKPIKRVITSMPVLPSKRSVWRENKKDSAEVSSN